MHQLRQEKNNAEIDFHLIYFGEEVLNNLKERTSFDNWSDAKNKLFVDLMKKLAELLPNADHVVRRDVTNVDFIYIGYQSPGGPSRGHYIDISSIDNGFQFRIGGAGANEEGRQRLVNEFDCTRHLEGFEITTTDSPNDLFDILSNVANEYNPRIHQQKNGSSGLTPRSARNATQRRGAAEARELIVAECRNRRKDFTDKQWNHLTSVLNTQLVPLAIQGLPAAEAVKLL